MYYTLIVGSVGSLVLRFWLCLLVLVVMLVCGVEVVGVGVGFGSNVGLWC